MIDAANYEASETLKSGMAVKIRSVRTDDKQKIHEAFRNLESESIYTRFFQLIKDLTDKELQAATEVDLETVVALVVTIGDGDREVIIGGGRYVTCDVTPGSIVAEVAFTVEEDYHGQGIASRLLRHLAGIAKQKGVNRFVAEVLPENKAMLAVFSRGGFPVKSRLEDGVMHVTISLTGDDA